MNNTNYNHKQNMVLVTKPWLICDLNNYNNHVFFVLFVVKLWLIFVRGFQVFIKVGYIYLLVVSNFAEGIQLEIYQNKSHLLVKH